MILSKDRWKIKYENEYNDDEVIDIICKQKGIDDYIKYFNLSFKDLYDPFLFKNMDIVLKKIKMAIRNEDKILIYGDYDVDGITATSIMYRFLKEKGADVHYMVPNRFQTGYGLSPENIESIINDGYKLLITVDNGITAVDEVKELQKNNIQVIITDHHEPKEELPDTEYIIHSYIFNDYPFPHLCGAGVAFKICEAWDRDLSWKYVDLAMLGTIADMMPLLDENKAIVNEGLKLINNSNVRGLRALLNTVNIKVTNIKDISYNIAPKLNSLGRIGDATIAIDLLTTDNDEVINDCIAKILDADKLRKELTIQNTELAYKMIQEDDLVNIIYSSNFYEGVLGIIAQKIMKKTGKITGIFNVDSENNARGSFRTVGEYNILSMLDENKDLLDKFGGHEKACGVNMRASKIKELKERLSNMVKADLPISKEVEVSLILNHTLVNSDFFLELQKYELEDTVFEIENIEVVETTLLASKHTRIRGRLSTNKYISIVVFNDPALNYNLSYGDRINIIGTLNLNTQNGYNYFQVISTDYEVNGIQVIDYRKRYDYIEASKYFNNESGLQIKDNFDNISDLSLILKEQTPNIIYLMPLESKDQFVSIKDKKLLKEAIFRISQSVRISELMLQKDLRVSRSTLNLILQIFKELDLIEIDNGTIMNIPHFKGFKVDLESSETFNKYVEKEDLYNILYGPLDKIKKFVNETLE